MEISPDFNKIFISLFWKRIHVERDEMYERGC